MIIFKKEYDDESLYDLDRDVSEAIDDDFNPKLKSILTDEHGFRLGKFTVTIEWSEE
jgi:hypothetical protein